MNDRVFIMRQSIIKLTQMLAGSGIQVTQQGISAYVRSDVSGKPILVNLPYMPDNATDELIDAIQGFLDHEVAHILFTEFAMMGEAMKDAAGPMLNILEDTRIERCMATKFQGSAHNLANTGRFFLDKYTVPKMKEAIAKGDNDMLTGVLMVPLLRGMAGQLVFKDFMKDKMTYVEPVYEKIKDLAEKIENLQSTRECLDLARVIVKRLRDGEEEEGSGGSEPSKKGKPSAGGSKSSKGKVVKGVASEKEPEEGEKTESKTAGAIKTPAAPAPKPEPKDDEEPIADEPAPADDPEDSTEEPEEDDEPAAAKPAAAEADDESTSPPEPEPEEIASATGEDSEEDDDDLSVSDMGEGEASGAESVTTPPLSSSSWKAIDKETKNDYDDSISGAISMAAAAASKDADYLIFTTDGDVVEPLHVGSDYRDTMLTSLADRVDHMVSPLQKDLERAISARSLSQYSAGHRSGRLHAANLSRLSMGDDRVFRRKHEATSKDVAVQLVVDASGSMYGSKIRTATEAAYALSSTLERIGIKSEVICFTTGPVHGDSSRVSDEQTKLGRKYSRTESLYMPILKGFDERLGTEVKKRFAWLPNSSILANNIDGECVQVAARRLMGRRETGKVMIVLSDGQPSCYGSSTQLQAHLKKTVKDITKAGVNVVGIGIESEAVQSFYPKFMILRSVSELPGAVMKELRALIIK